MKEKTGSTFVCFSGTSCELLPLSWLVYSILYFCPGYVSDAGGPVSPYPFASITDFPLFIFRDIYSRQGLLFNYSFWDPFAVHFYLVSS